jgi:hypothetical protein
MASGWSGGTGEQAGLGDAGYVAPTDNEFFADGATLMITNGLMDSLSWDCKYSGADLLDLSDPIHPTFVASGVYAVMVQIGPASNMTPGGAFDYALVFHTVAVSGQVIVAGAAGLSAESLRPATQANAVVAATAGDSLELQVGNLDGLQDLGFRIVGASIQRIS